MKVKMSPHDSESVGVGGISTVIEKYHLHLPSLGVSLARDNESYDVQLVHAGVKQFDSPRGANIAMLHGLYWTGETPLMGNAYYATNQKIVANIRQAAVVTVPSEWVGETIKREFSIIPHIVPHGVDMEEWIGGSDRGYVLWAKNNNRGVCDPTPLVAAAKHLPDIPFISTFSPPLPNVKTPNRAFTTEEMRNAILNCSVYMATTQETFGIATLEAMAAGKPVVGYRIGFQPVIHKVTGYLAAPGDTADLARGIRWAMEHREVLGANGREIASRYSWKDACSALVEAMMAAEDVCQKERGVTVVIPYRNKGEVVKEAIDSALNQTISDQVKVVVVDDASDDDTAQRICGEYSKFVRYIRLGKRGGVANARNVGVDAAGTEFIVCLDSDDMLAPQFVDTCFRKIAHDRSIGIVYTGLGKITDEGPVLQSWPGPFDFWQQAEGRNQVPTAAMFRKEMWRRVGGYRPRYTRYDRVGFGSEDAAFWLHGSAIGYEAVQVSRAPLFWYRPGGGTTTRGYRELAWNNFYKWDTHGYPIGSPLRKGMISWPVHIYSPPTVSVIIPVGPGHEIYAADAIDSVMAQTHRKAETIVVWDSPEPIPSWYTGGYPAAKFIRTGGGAGAGKARNIGAEKAKGRFIVFLDADDYLLPNYIDSCLRAWKQHKAIIYTDYYGVHDIPQGKEPESIKGYISHDTAGNTVVNNNRLLEYDMARAARQPEENPYVWSLVTCLVPREWHVDIGGFKDDLESWEDWDWHVRMAKRGRDYYHLKEPLLYYRKWTGKRAMAAVDRWAEWNLPDRIG